MASNNVHDKTVSPETETPHSTSIFRPASTRRTQSFSSSSPSHDSWDSMSGNEEFSSCNASTPAGPKFSGGGVPFSWEQLPGIPKQQSPKKKDSSIGLLPLPPPAGNSNPSKKQNHEEVSPKKHYTDSDSFRKDPFFAALVECSKDDGDQTDGLNLWKRSRASRSLSDRFGFINMYTSCKRTCAVSESIVYLPRSTPHYLLNRRPG